MSFVLNQPSDRVDVYVKTTENLKKKIKLVTCPSTIPASSHVYRRGKIKYGLLDQYNVSYSAFKAITYSVVCNMIPHFSSYY